jgi:hypothetical protein
MRLDELLRADVFDADGVKLGHVRDVRIVQDGPALGHRGAPLFRVHGLIVGPGGVGERLGYGRAGLKGPWLFTKLFARRPEHFVPWGQIGRRADGRIDLTTTKAELHMPDPIDPEDARDE